MLIKNRKIKLSKYIHMKKTIIVLMLTILAGLNSQAQLGGLLKKVKEKSTEKKTNSTSTTSTNESTTKANEDIKPIEDGNVKSALTNYEILDNQTFSVFGNGGANRYTINDFKEHKLNSLIKMRKQGETGLFHFAKDYDEVKPFLFPANDKTKIIFSSTSFEKEIPSITNTFSSKGHIYAKLETGSGTVKDVFKLDEKSNFLKVKILIYR